MFIINLKPEMINWRIISKIIGQLLLMEVAFLLGCLCLSWCYDASDAVAFAISCGITSAAALLFIYLGRNATSTMSRRDSFLVVSMAWVVFSLFGALPFLLSGTLVSPIDAFFETMSGFTTTGASLIDDVESMPRALLFWRSLTQWIGGLGIVFFTIAVIPSMVGGSVRVFAAEATGPLRTKMHPRLSTTGRWIWGIYTTLTTLCAVCFFLEGMSGFDAVNYAMTVAATGGFATHNASTGYFHNVAIDYTAILFMFLCGVSFTLLYTTLFRRKLRDFFSNTELRLFVTIIIASTLFISTTLWWQCHYDLLDALRYGLFQVVSFITTTGIFNDDAGQWPHITWVVLTLCMFIGGCSGSTAGGFKCIRLSLLFQIVRNELQRLLHPSAVLPTRAGHITLDYSRQVTLLAFLAAYFGLCFVTYFIMILAGVDSTNSITIAFSCASNVGPTLGLEIGPTMSWSVLPEFVKLLLTLLMLMGRLEILSVLVLFTRAFWNFKK